MRSCADRGLREVNELAKMHIGNAFERGKVLQTKSKLPQLICHTSIHGLWDIFH